MIVIDCGNVRPHRSYLELVATIAKPEGACEIMLKGDTGLQCSGKAKTLGEGSGRDYRNFYDLKPAIGPDIVTL